MSVAEVLSLLLVKSCQSCFNVKYILDILHKENFQSSRTYGARKKEIKLQPKPSKKKKTALETTKLAKRHG